MAEHPIQGLMNVTMEKIHQMVDSNTIIGKPITTEDGITILDFKTDHIRQETMEDAVARYRPQLETYAEALSRIYEKPVKQRLLYFFHLGQLAEV